MRNVDERFKDSSPVETVNRIKDILNQNGLRVQENWFDSKVKNCYSLRASIEGTNFGTNGKGVTKELANASAHAELMERLQAGIMGRNGLTFKDSVNMDRQMLIEQCAPFFDRIADTIEKFTEYKVSTEQMADVCLSYEHGQMHTKALPFYSVTEDKMVYIPERLLMPLFSSTGNCAGNTPEEAIVQGLSEIIERWFQRHFLCQDVVPPTIPDEYLKNYARAYETITDIRSNGYDVIIKDCSMGSGYPVIATAVIDKKRHAYHVHMGASPVFEIALGRSLTETFQGRLIDDVADTGLWESAKNDKAVYRKAYNLGRGAYPIEFFTENSTYPFVPFPDRIAYTNKDLLKYAVDFIAKQNMHMYVRDMSHLGFCSYKVIVPDMCKEDCDFITSDVGVSYLIGDTSEAELDLQNATDDQLFELRLLNLYKLNNYLVDKDPRFFKLTQLHITDSVAKDRAAGIAHMAYVEWQCGNEVAAMDYAAMIQKLSVKGISDFCSCLLRAKAMMPQYKNLDEICDRLSLFYDVTTISDVKSTITDGSNPFANYVVKCGRKDGCQECFYNDQCFVKKHEELLNIVNSHIEKFDDEKAFENLRNLFCHS